ncbi:hypothetical protein Glove_164g56 [Diversispora epigaea]|uniref:Uncharacterized protein n=1 Tax=Diversispora epigaea TaxID=1348612 RepID=A0A397IRA6_9GLOM|nr:hypothetical protein Glove_164g56 [Diversispora epigaea]
MRKIISRDSAEERETITNATTTTKTSATSLSSTFLGDSNRLKLSEKRLDRRRNNEILSSLTSNRSNTTFRSTTSYNETTRVNKRKVITNKQEIIISKTLANIERPIKVDLC